MADDGSPAPRSAIDALIEKAAEIVSWACQMAHERGAHAKAHDCDNWFAGYDDRAPARQLEKGAHVMEQDLGEMHWKDDWMFKRLEDGSVRIRKSVGEMTIDGVTQPMLATAIIPAAEWVSLIHHLSRKQTAESFQVARELHGHF